jgi:tripartite-type tricarboxylate transporter receptor subunit TctC
MLAPAGTPSAIVRRLSQEITKILAQPEARDKLLSIGLEAGGSTPEEFDTAIKADLGRIGKVIKEAGITAE